MSNAFFPVAVDKKSGKATWRGSPCASYADASERANRQCNTDTKREQCDQSIFKTYGVIDDEGYILAPVVDGNGNVADTVRGVKVEHAQATKEEAK